MRIQLLKTYANPNGTGREGDVQDVAQEFAYRLIAAGAAISLEVEATAFVTEKPKRKGRTKIVPNGTLLNAKVETR